MKIQLAYKFTGEDRGQLIETLKKISQILKESGHETYTPLLDPNVPTEKKKLYVNALKKIDGADALLTIINSEEKSEGMLMEIGYALGRSKKLIVAIQEQIKKTHMRDFADEVIEFEDINDLYEKLRNIK